MRVAAALAVLLAAAAPLVAETLPVPSQEDWVGAKQRIPLPEGPTLAYVEMGDTDGPPVLLIHGYTDNSRSWSLLAPHLPGQRLIAVDLRGHGASDAPACCYAPDSLAYDIGAFLDEMGIEQADVIGHSLGAVTAAVFAATQPDRVRRLVLISASPATGGGPGTWLWDNVLPLEPPLDPDSQFMLDWYWNPNPVPPEFLDRERAESAAVPKHVWTGVLHGLTLADWSPLAPAIVQPTLILWGDQDSLFDAAHQERLRVVLPAAHFESFAGYGHNMFWETPEDVGALLTAFLAP